MPQIQILMPQMGESLTEGTVVRWLKQPGQVVERDEPLCEISTDKVDTDIPAPAAGTLGVLLVQEGQTVSVGQPMAVIETAEGAAAPRAADAARAETAASSDSAGHFKSSHAPQLVSFRRADATEERDREKGQRRPGTQAAPAIGESAIRGRTYSPAVLELAGRHRVPFEALTRVQGSGRGGRLTKKDLQRFLDSGGGPSDAGTAAQSTRDSLPSIPPEYLYHPKPEDQRAPFSPVRRRIAHHMSWSVRISPHATAFGEIDMATATRSLQQRRERFEQQTGAPLTVTALLAQAAVRALEGFPALNASILGDDLVLKPHVHLGIAVALQDRDELIVPVVRNAEELSLAGLARAIHDLATRARSRALTPEDVQGGSFTLTNPGIFGGLNGTPILNQPQVAILGFGAIVKRPVVIDDAIGIRPMMGVALTFDHRAADGMLAFRYLERLRQLLEQPPAELPDV
jgi:pyruvate dehydrogenase E2 component (dihydrolipoamide acetyltransferase)